MNNNFNRQIWFIALVILFGCLIGTCVSMLIGAVLPDGVVKDFFLSSQDIGWATPDGNWVDLYLLKFKIGFNFKKIMRFSKFPRLKNGDFITRISMQHGRKNNAC